MDYTFTSETLTALHQYAKPYEDPNTTVLRVLEQLENSLGPSLAPEAETNSDAAGEPNHYKGTDLKHTRILRATLGGQEIVRPKWNSIMGILCTKAIATKGLNWMRERKSPSVVPGKRKDSGFHHLPGTDASVQYTDASKAWMYTKELAEQLDVAVEVVFEWRDKTEALKPGEKAVVRC